ncbi:MAG: hypothetical protein K5853_05830 [Lachnospiraceae bacterium]|nr:hypothetical protein [Lachnospiraceae bacterium]
MMDKTLSSREKGDIYWRKRIMYIASAASKSGRKAGYLNRDTAEDTLDIYRGTKPALVSPYPGGKEFYVCPPTAAGQKYFAESVASLMHVRDYIKEILSSEGLLIHEVVRTLFYDSMHLTLNVTEAVINDFFAISGLDPEGKELLNKPDRKTAVSAFKKSCEEYEKTVSRIFSVSSEKMIQMLCAEAGLDSSSPTDAPLTDESFEGLLESDPASVMLYGDEMNKLRRIMGAALQETADRKHLREELKQMFFEKYYNDEVDPVLRRLVTDAFLEYRHQVDNRLIRLLYTRQACYYYAYYLITDEPVDAVIHKRIREDLDVDVDVDVEVLDEGMLLNELPGFALIEEDASFDEIPSSYEDIIASGNVLRQYLLAHPGQFDAQCLLSVAVGNEELGGVLHRAFLLAKGVDIFTAGGKAEDMDKSRWILLFDTWVVSYTICRVIVSMTEFLNENKTVTVGVATKKLLTLLPDISYTAVEKHSREVLREIILLRSGKGDLYK